MTEPKTAPEQQTLEEQRDEELAYWEMDPELVHFGDQEPSETE